MKRVGMVFGALCLTTLSVWQEAGADEKGTQRVILDTLGHVGTRVTFDIFGSGGQAVAPEQIVGPPFVLKRWTTLTLVGAYLNNCNDILSGVPFCTAQFPFLVQIHRASPNGLPEPESLATYQLTHDHDPLKTRFEFARPNLLLPPGRYFALFSPRWATDQGQLLAQATNPVLFDAGHVALGFLNPQTGVAAIGQDLGAAVRILGVPLFRDRDGRADPDD